MFPTEKVEVVFVWRTKDVEEKMCCLMLQETLRRAGVCCNPTQWMGGSGTYG